MPARFIALGLRATAASHSNCCWTIPVGLNWWVPLFIINRTGMRYLAVIARKGRQK